jgi:hypothetical protein
MENQVTPAMMKSATDVVCESCGCHTFKPVAMLKKISALLSPNGRETIVPIQAFACDKCSHVNEEFVPKFN